MAVYWTQVTRELTEQDQADLFMTREGLKEHLGRPPTREEWEISKALKFGMLFNAGPRVLLHSIASCQYPQLAMEPLPLWDQAHTAAPSIRKACRAFCGPRVYQRPSHVPSQALRPWRGAVVIALDIRSTTTGRFSSIGGGLQ